jgi:hypothetical protein
VEDDVLACVDVSYPDAAAIAGCLLFPDWSSLTDTVLESCGKQVAITNSQV